MVRREVLNYQEIKRGDYDYMLNESGGRHAALYCHVMIIIGD